MLVHYRDSDKKNDIPVSEALPLPVSVVGASTVEITTDAVNVTGFALETTQQEVLTAAEAIQASVAAGATQTTLAALLAIVGDAADAAGDPTVIGLLKQIAENTAA